MHKEHYNSFNTMYKKTTRDSVSLYSDLYKIMETNEESYSTKRSFKSKQIKNNIGIYVQCNSESAPILVVSKNENKYFQTLRNWQMDRIFVVVTRIAK